LAQDWLTRNAEFLGHLGLDVLGLVPGYGEAFDLGNALWYALDKDRDNAVLSLLSAIPGLGYGAGVVKVTKYFKYGKDVNKSTEKAAEEAGKLATPPCKCFPAGTTVDTASGAKPIEDIKVGDRVWARDQVTGKSELRKVTGLFQKKTTDLMTITLVGGGVVAVTTEHPFYTPDRGWVESGDLKPGDKLLQRNGKTARIRSITHASTTTTVYNFSVANDHNYYVGPASLLVHNCPTDPPGESKGSTGRTNLSPHEQWMIDLAKQNPEHGERIPLTMKDERWKADDGWVKMKQELDGVEVHYVYNTKTLQTDDFKPKDWDNVPPDK
jgi:hypothetical protein